VAAELKILLGNTIKSRRSALGISQEELAARAGLHRTYVSDVERGARNPSLESVQKLASALELSLPTLFQKASDGESRLVEILLVEDNLHDIKLTTRAFEKARVMNPMHVVRDGVEALEFLFATGRHANRKDAALPEVILLDLNLPEKNGIEVLREIKADERTRRIPVVILTISSRERDITECRRLGADTYIVKPVRFKSFGEVASNLNLAWTLVRPLSDATIESDLPGGARLAVTGRS